MPPRPLLPNGRPIPELLADVARAYPGDQVAIQMRDIPRITFHVSLALQYGGVNAALCDLGSGIGIFPVACREIPMAVTIVDDFQDDVNTAIGDVTRDIHIPRGVTVINTDVIAAPPTFPDNAFDVVTCFDSMEHWHNSPKPLFRQVLKWLKPGGTFIVSVPNCVNLRKRITVPLGQGKWSPMADWYEADRFRGHVREPDVADLRYIAADLGLQAVQVLGRNWLGYNSGFWFARTFTGLVDRPLRSFPSLCANLYLIGRKPSAPNP